MSARISVCAQPGCPELTARTYCDTHRLANRRTADRRRPNARERGYDEKWRRTRGRFLQLHPLCECDDCLAKPESQRPPATDVDHRDGKGPLGPNGHKHSNLRAMAHGHHSKRTARDQPGGWNAR